MGAGKFEPGGPYIVRHVLQKGTYELVEGPKAEVEFPRRAKAVGSRDYLKRIVPMVYYIFYIHICA